MCVHVHVCVLVTDIALHHWMTGGKRCLWQNTAAAASEYCSCDQQHAKTFYKTCNHYAKQICTYMYMYYTHNKYMYD